MDTKAKLAKLRGLHAELAVERDHIEGQMHDVAAEIDDLEGDTHSAAWNRARAKASRSGDRADHAEAHRLWVVMMAHMHLRSGRSVSCDGASEIEAEMDRLREQTAQH